jgi:hypothetical protein
MKIIVQKKKLDKHTRELIQEEVALDNSDYDGNYYVRLTIGDANVELPVTDLFTAIEAFYRHEVRGDEEQIRMEKLEKNGWG